MNVNGNFFFLLERLVLWLDSVFCVCPKKLVYMYQNTSKIINNREESHLYNDYYEKHLPKPN